MVVLCSVVLRSGGAALDGVLLGWRSARVALCLVVSSPFHYSFATLLLLFHDSFTTLSLPFCCSLLHLCAGIKNNTRIGIGIACCFVALCLMALRLGGALLGGFFSLSLLFLYSFTTLLLLFLYPCTALFFELLTPSRGIAPLPREQPACQAPAARHKSPRSFLYKPHFYQSFLPKVWFIRKKMLPLRPKFSFNTLIFL